MAATSTVSKGRVMTARFSGSCKACGARLAAGTQIRYSKAVGATCVDCSTAAESSDYGRCGVNGGRCEDAPCCGCLAEGVYGSRYDDAPDCDDFYERY